MCWPQLYETSSNNHTDNFFLDTLFFTGHNKSKKLENISNTYQQRYIDSL
jgi:hypothetical protein